MKMQTLSPMVPSVLRNTRVGELCLSWVLQASSNLSLGSDHELQ